MKKIDKQSRARKSALADSLDEKHHALDDAISLFNAAVREAWQALNPAVESYNEIVREVEEFKTEIAAEIESYVDERSERWQASDAASSYEEWKRLYDEAFDEVSLDEPDDIELPDDIADGDTLREISDEVSL